MKGGWPRERDMTSAFRELSLCCRAPSLGVRNQPDSFYVTEAMPLPPLPRTYESASRSKAYVLKVSLTSWCVGFIVYNTIGPLQGCDGAQRKECVLVWVPCPAGGWHIALSDWHLQLLSLPSLQCQRMDR